MVTAELTLQEALKEYFGFDKFKGDQEEIIKCLLGGRDTFVIMPTGGGKSLCYQLPAMLTDGTAIIVSPLIALMKNQVDSIRNFGADDAVAHVLNSSLTKGETAQVKEDIVAGKTKMLFVAPESLNKQENIDFFKQIKISFVAVDEAHCISEWGHDFRPEYRRIKEMVKDIDSEIPLMALTATATPKVQLDIQKNLGMDNARVFKSSFNRANLYYEIRPKIEVAREIIRFIKQNEGKSGIVYCLSRKKVEEIAETLVVNGIKARGYHAGMDAATRVGNQDAFLMEDVDVIVATIAFGMGIDKPDVRFVIHHDMPKSLEGYYQETGRGGRDGGEGKCIAFYSYKDIEKLEKFMTGKPIAEQEIGRLLLMETVSFAETSICRRKHLLHYFGEFHKEDNCGNCDNCVNPKEKIEGQEIVALVLKTIVEIGQKFKIKHVVNIIAGHESNAVKTYKHNLIDVFGKGKDYGDKIWESAIRQTLIAGLLTKDIENYGTLQLSETGKEFLKSPQPFTITKDHDYSDVEGDNDIIVAGKAGGAAADELLFNLLMDERRRISKDIDKPPFVIFQETSLQDMATQYPITMDELKNIIGVGSGKAMKFGQSFIELIAEYVEENEIERPQDMVVKSVVNKSGSKVYFIQSVDRKMPLPDIAKAKGLKMQELITELEAIVDSGTRLSINYCLDDTMDEDHQEEVFDYFSEAETDSIQDALDELGEDEYSEDDIRLMRIKYISEVGN
ncbi:MAG: DNA helicase RecQ [Flavobacteriales bacterium]|nr:DNA helicase RecQ [Flavobacteriales bacterium]